MKIAILGAGKLGLRIAEALLNNDSYDITIVDTNEDKLEQISQTLDVLTFAGDAKTSDTLKQIKIKDFDFLLSCTSSDDTNIIAASIARSLGCKKTVARVCEPEHMNQLDFLCTHFGIDAVINPDMLITGEIYRYLIDKYSLTNGMYCTKRIAVVEFDVSRDPSLINMKMTSFREHLPNFFVVGMSRHGKIIMPNGNDKILPGDMLYIIGEKNEILEYSRKLHPKRKKVEAHKVMIVGGGRTGFYLAKKLSEYGAFVKIIEHNLKRCHYLTSHLKNVTVIHGNGTDIDLLEEEKINEMNAVVTATGFDEENLLVAVTAKSFGVDDAISKVSHESYDELISKLGVDIVLNPLDISASAILRILNGSERVLSDVLLQGQAQLLQIYTSPNMYLLSKDIQHLNLPDFVKIAAINRGNETIIPTGKTKIKAGDHVILICLLSNIGYIEKLTQIME